MGNRLPLSLFVLFGTLCVTGRTNAAPRASVRSGPTENTGTTPHLQEIFLGRCWGFQQLWQVSPEVNCTDLWDKFFGAFSYREPCDVMASSYDPFFQASTFETPVNKTMFWSGTNVLAHAYSDEGHRYRTLEDTLPGHILNGLQWCGSPRAPGFNDTVCPQCENRPFWPEASKFFAQRARGDVFVMLNGTRRDASGNPEDAFRTTSIFARVELPSLNKNAISTIHVWVIHDLDSDPPYSESCGKGSLSQLEQILSYDGFHVICQDDPPSLRHQQCVDAPYSPLCTSVTSKAPKKNTIYNSFLSVVIVSIVLNL
ncbi:BST1 [Branchiostoma lanceolatum]|uniref:ADP-ribosyl cyclase/cyclic ADP-ribose hydrolase n=1 Tax=Branchiostoma lanceolatum TaxID=7740 RepID=A0A8K0EEV5_BRALA|nr:BST1 [Branchiostoma lanceolatum]